MTQSAWRSSSKVGKVEARPSREIMAAASGRTPATVYTKAPALIRSVAKDLMAMKVDELKEELEARGEGKSGNKAWLRRRLHAAIVSEYLESGEE